MSAADAAVTVGAVVRAGSGAGSTADSMTAAGVETHAMSSARPVANAVPCGGSTADDGPAA